jgi:protein phosphatase inhibitor 2
VQGNPGEEVEMEEEMDEEAAAKHAAFVRARGRHYSNEAEAMKRAAKMVDDEEEDVTEEASALADGANDVAVNGVVHGN